MDINNAEKEIKVLTDGLEKFLKGLEEILDLVPSEIHRDAGVQRFEFSFCQKISSPGFVVTCRLQKVKNSHFPFHRI